ncbi:MAG: M28 family peptidase [Pyrinomonadaceae bacterium]
MTTKSRRQQWGSILLIAVLLHAGGTISLFAQGAAERSTQASTTTPDAFKDPALVRRYQQALTPGGMASRLYFLASDLFEGREATTRGQRLAASYLASQYRQMGLAPRGTTKPDDPLALSAYFQPFNVYRKLPREARLEVVRGNSPLAKSIFSAESHDDLAYFLSGSPVSASGGVLFAGYGIADDHLRYNDYAALAGKGLTADGKWVMILADEPLTDASTSLLPTPNNKPSKWTTQFPHKFGALFKSGRGAKGLLIVSDATPRAKGTFADAAAQASQAAQGIGSPLWLSAEPPTNAPPAYMISKKMANQILAASGQTVEGMAQEINKSLKPVVFDVKDTVVNTTVDRFDALRTENVLAFIEGSDPRLKDEVLIISAHYDHLGINPALKGDQIFNGAADDGSGTVAVLALAEAFMKAKTEGHGPRRSILFINFSGEERGLVGSSYYTDTAPVVPLEQTVADINMDGVAGFDPKHPSRSRNYIYMVGSKSLSDELLDINRRLNDLTGVKLELNDSDSFPSDQVNFERQLVPYLYYSTGLTEHYHKPTDEPETIDYAHLTRITQLVFATAWQAANQDARLASVDRKRLVIDGYVCPPCGFDCDDVVHQHPGMCPVCGMNLIPNVKLKS